MLQSRVRRPDAAGGVVGVLTTWGHMQVSSYSGRHHNEAWQYNTSHLSPPRAAQHEQAPTALDGGRRRR
jgi:hypothetical protein